MKKEKILITSASSYVGFYIAKRLISAGHEVVFTYRTPSSRIRELLGSPNAKGLNLDFNTNQSIEKKISEKFSLIINSTGAYPAQDISNDDVARVNVNAAIWASKILENSVKQCNIVNFSSLSVYGWPLPSSIDDHTRPAPTDVYGSSKLMSEQLLSAHSTKSAVVNVRFPVVLGRGAHRAWLPRVLESVRKGLTIDLYNSDMCYTTCTTLPDVYLIVEHMLNENLKKGVISVPIGSRPDITIAEIVSYIADRVGAISRCRFLPGGHNCTQLHSLAAAEIGYRFPGTSSCVKYWLDEELIDV